MNTRQKTYKKTHNNISKIYDLVIIGGAEWLRYFQTYRTT